MEKWDDRPFQLLSEPSELSGTAIDVKNDGWNVFELESRINLRSKIHEFIDLTNTSTLSTSELRQQLMACHAHYGPPFATQLVHALQNHDEAEREAVTWLLVQLDDPATIPQLFKLMQQPQQARTIRLAAALTLAGMGATQSITQARKPRLYALS